MDTITKRANDAKKHPNFNKANKDEKRGLVGIDWKEEMEGKSVSQSTCVRSRRVVYTQITATFLTDLSQGDIRGWF